MRSPRSAYWSRRKVLATAGITSVAAILYGSYPSFWNRSLDDIRRPILPVARSPEPHLWPDKGLHAAWLGHSTVLVKCEGVTILTDPIFSDRAGISVGPLTVGVKRLVAPALSFPELPKIDLVLLSHAHMDHFDLPSLRKLESKHTTVVTASGTKDLLRPHRYAKVRELRWDEEARVPGGHVRAFEVNHWGSRLRRDRWRGYNGYLLEIGRFRILFAGDTAYTSQFRKLRSSKAVDLAVMPIGCYNPWRRNHCTPEEAWAMGNDAGAEVFVPVHHQTFTLSSEPAREPLARFVAAAAGETERVAIREIGQETHL